MCGKNVRSVSHSSLKKLRKKIVYVYPISQQECKRRKVSECLFSRKGAENGTNTCVLKVFYYLVKRFTLDGPIANFVFIYFKIGIIKSKKEGLIR